MSSKYVIGDVHGHYDKLIRLLQQTRLIGCDHKWTGNDATLCFISDYFDRGPNGIGCIELVMRLQQEAGVEGGQVIALMGNHEPLILSALRFGQTETNGPGRSFVADWQFNGGQADDLERLTSKHIDWLLQLPTLVKLDDWLLLHADAFFYSSYGTTINEINQRITSVLVGDDPNAWQQLLRQFAERYAYTERIPGGATLAKIFINNLDCKRLIHGHTPISVMASKPAHLVTEPYIYADGLCTNIDPSMYMGGPGFVYKLPTI
ncbi:metallophosphoesterase [Chloroflexi bacterium TSY]|nr:metallophosphoesterase [Chloroflexi bacterium TSY]